MKVSAKILVGDNRQTLESLPDQSIQTVVTSPPYWGLRDYGTKSWTGGDESCEHVKDSSKTKKFGNEEFNKNRPSREATKTKGYYYEGTCGLCGAVEEDLQIGLEQTPDEFIEQLCLVFDEVWRVLKDDGTIWVNLGDSYAAMRDSKASPDSLREGDGTAVPQAANRNPANLKAAGLKHKDLVGVPWRFAFAMQARGWYLRSDIIWHKPNPMPESVTDRPTKSHEYIFLMTKNARYYYDHKAILEPVSDVSLKRAEYGWDSDRPSTKNASMGGTGIHVEQMGTRFVNPEGRNKRTVWTITTKGYPEAHFATYPPDLILPCILAGSKEGDTVLDPFSGSGTTGEVSLKNNRNYIGLELNPEYAKISEKRITDAIGMFGEVEVQIP
jgi:DNA modification methylase